MSVELPRRVDVVVVGAGILGLSCAVELARLRPAWQVIVAEKEPSPALHQTGRNSGVVHTGVYYAPRSMKAELCTRGRELLLDFCSREEIPYDVCGKVIVAADGDELGRLAELEQRAVANGVPAERIGAQRLRELEPHCNGIAALHLPGPGLSTTGSSPLHSPASSRRGGRIALNVRVEELDERSRSVAVRTSLGDVETKYVIACAGVHADDLVGRDGDNVRIVPFAATTSRSARGAAAVSQPDLPGARPAFPFLGVARNRRPDGGVWAGPMRLSLLHGRVTGGAT